MNGLTIGIGDLRKKSTHRKIRESLLESAGVGKCPGLSNWCTFELANRLAEICITATELEIIRFWTFPFGELVYLISTQALIWMSILPLLI